MKESTCNLNKIDEIVRLYQEGKTCEEIGEKTGYAGNTVRKKLIIAGVVKKQKRLSEKEKEEICDDFKNGQVAEGIAKKFGVTRSTILRILTGNGLRNEGSPVAEKKRETLCINCKHAAKGDISICPWAARGKPRDDWNATRRDFPIYNNEYAESYMVLGCPGFEKG